MQYVYMVVGANGGSAPTRTAVLTIDGTPATTIIHLGVGVSADLIYFDSATGRLQVGKWYESEGGGAVNATNIMAFQFGSVIGFDLWDEEWSADVIKFNTTDTPDEQFGYDFKEYVPRFNFFRTAPDWNGTGPAPETWYDSYHNLGNVRLGKGDPCRLAGMSVGQIKNFENDSDLYGEEFRIAQNNGGMGWRTPTAIEILTSFADNMSNPVHPVVPGWRTGDGNIYYVQSTGTGRGTTQFGDVAYYANFHIGREGTRTNPDFAYFPVKTGSVPNVLSGRYLPMVGMRHSDFISWGENWDFSAGKTVATWSSTPSSVQYSPVAWVTQSYLFVATGFYEVPGWDFTADRAAAGLELTVATSGAMARCIPYRVEPPATITFTDGTATATLTGNAGGTTFKVDDTSGSDLTWTVTSSDSTWLTINTTSNAAGSASATGTGSVSNWYAHAAANNTGALRTATITLERPRQDPVSITVIQEAPGILAAPGVIGYIADGPRAGQLTLRGSIEFAGTPVDTYSPFGPDKLEDETVYVAYFRFSSLVAIGSQPKPTAAFNASNVVWAPAQFTYPPYTGLEAAVRRAADLGWADGIPFINDALAGWNLDLPNGLGEPCRFYFDDNGNMNPDLSGNYVDAWRLPVGGFSNGNGGWNGGSFGTTSISSQPNWTLANGARWVPEGTDDVPVAGAVAGAGAGQPDWSMFLPAAGSRLSGAGGVFDQNNRSHYWSSSPNTSINCFGLSSTNSSVAPNNSLILASGTAVRCVRTEVAPSLEVDRESVRFFASGAAYDGENTVNVTAVNLPGGWSWDWGTGGNQSSWLTVTQTATSLVFAASNNASNNERIASIVVSAAGVPSITISVVQDVAPSGVHAPPGVLGATASGKLTLRGSQIYASNPQISAYAESEFGSLENEDVYLLHFKWGSVVGMWSRTDSHAFNAADIAWVHPEYTNAHGKGIDAMKALVRPLTGSARWNAVTDGRSGGLSFVMNSAIPANTLANLAAGTGDPCAFADKGTTGAAQGYDYITPPANNAWNNTAYTNAAGSLQLEWFDADALGADIPGGRLSRVAGQEGWFFPTTGYMLINVNNQSVDGRYWSGTANSHINGRFLNFNNASTVSPTSNTEFVSAYGVRCVRQEIQQAELPPPAGNKWGNNWPETKWVGTFHRNGEMGERIIYSTHEGAWSAEVISGNDFIKIDGGDANIGTRLTAMYEGAPGNPESYIVGDVPIVSGVDNILFRVGLKSTRPAGTAPRYGKIRVTWNNGGTPTEHIMYVRQGETAAAIGDPSVLWSPYNVGNYANPTEFGGDSGFVQYPTQAGYLKQWSNVTTMWTPVDPITPSSWTSSPVTSSYADVCPSGYKTPTWPTSLTTPEFGSLFTGTNAGELPQQNIWGYYADGYFDRHPIENSMCTLYPNAPPQAGANPGLNSAVNATRNDVGYRGYLFVNLSTDASLFFPAAGYRRGDSTNTGVLANAGFYGYYWSSTSSQRMFFSVTQSERGTAVLPNAFNIRCVRNTP
jgi:hypothetical protein